MNILKSLFGGAGLTVQEAQTRLGARPAPFLLDVRQPDEFRQGHIAGAKLIPLSELSRRINEIPKDREVVCVCRSGSRSGMAARQLTAAGFQAVNLSGGMMAWQRAGYPVKRGQ